jgi:hypothetical protein
LKEKKEIKEKKEKEFKKKLFQEYDIDYQINKLNNKGKIYILIKGNNPDEYMNIENNLNFEIVNYEDFLKYEKNIKKNPIVCTR